MLRFFRTIRKQLMEQNKARIYLFYAVGEIALVMIGILLALQVSNWNDERKLQKEERYLLAELKQEFLQNQLSLDKSYIENSNGIESSLILINTLANKNSSSINYQYIDSLNYRIISGYNEYDPTSGVIDDIINSGKLEVIQNDSLRYILSQWSGQLIDINQDYEFRNEYFIHRVLPEMTLNFPMLNTLVLHKRSPKSSEFISTVNYSKIEYSQEIFNNRNLEGIIAMHVFNQDFILNNIKVLKSYISNAIQLIETEQKRLK